VNEVINIKVFAQVRQVSGDDVLTVEDDQAELYNSEYYSRLVYKESKGAEVILDFTDNELSIKRYDDWITQGILARQGNGTLLITTEEGTLTFDAKINKYQLKNHSIYVSYDLYQESKFVNHYTFECKWILEG